MIDYSKLPIQALARLLGIPEHYNPEVVAFIMKQTDEKYSHLQKLIKTYSDA